MPAARTRQGAAGAAPALTPGQKAAATRRRNAEARRLQQERQARGNQDAEGSGGTVRFDIPDDETAFVSAGHLQQSLSHVTATMAATDEHVESISSKVDELGSKLDALIARLGDPSPSSTALTPTHSAPAGSSTAQTVPLRGQHGECPPISRRYGYIDEKLRGEAMAGTMAPEKLPLLLPASSALATRQGEDDDTFEVNGVTVTKKKVPDQAAVLAKFVRGIPKPSAFAAAWGIYTDLLLHGMAAFDAKSVANAHSALLSHATWVLEHAENFTWESIMLYHLTVSNERKDGFTCGLWYKNYDGDAWGTIAVRKAPAQTNARSAHQNARPPAPTPAPASRPLPTTSAPRGRACVNWNAGVCNTDPCPRGYRHVCKRCQGSHVIRDCPKDKPE